jgi:addiction module HigA family antidote
MKRALHPGEILNEEFLKELKISVADFAKEINIPKEKIDDFICGKASMTGILAVKLSQRFNTTFQFWLNLQHNYETTIAENYLIYVSDRTGKSNS